MRDHQSSGPPTGSPPTQPPPSGIEWEKVARMTFRLAVPGGWLYRYESQYGGSTVFVPDPEVLYSAAVLASGGRE
jgi:hypothetical protein